VEKEKMNNSWFENIKNKKHKRSEYIISVVVNIILLYIVNNLKGWGVPFLADGWTACLWVLNISLISTVVGDFILIFFNFSWFRALVHLLLNIISIIVLYTFFVIFPFDLSSTWELVFKIFILIGMFGTIIGAAVELTRVFLVVKR